MRKIIILISLFISTQLFVQAQNVPTPKSHFGFSIGDNYHLATFTQTEAYLKKIAGISKKVKLENATIIPPCYIGDDVVLINATVGPNVSLGKGCHVIDSTIKNSLVQTHAHIKNAILDNAMIGNHASFDGKFKSISIGDYSVLE